uniref:Uncharacterized protein n=1 Tax=uncultured Acidobacteriota bacterium TaxID=171953 RepID=H5SH75_9BACT|nr:hypothetical protein HGMM_F28D03C18 [uncultured Acidobacteriota bacterium]
MLFGRIVLQSDVWASVFLRLGLLLSAGPALLLTVRSEVSSRVHRIVGYSLFVASVVLGVHGWISLWGDWKLPVSWPTASFFVVSAAVQLLAWGLIGLLLSRLHRAKPAIPDRTVFGFLLALVFGNLLYGFTPAAVAGVHFVLAILIVNLFRQFKLS